MRHKPPLFQLKGDGRQLFKQFMMVFPHGRAGVRSGCGAKLSKNCHLRGRLGALMLIAQNHLLTLRPRRWA